jgi:hypothetical protein
LTADGFECVEQFGGRIRDFRSGRSSGGYTQNNTFNAPMTGPVVQGQGAVVHQSQGIDAAALREIFTAMRAAFDEIQGALDTDDRDDLEYAIEAIERQGQADVPDKSRLGSAARRVREIGERTVETMAVKIGTETGMDAVRRLVHLAERLLT